VLDLGRTLREGSVDDLEHPERVADDPFAREAGEQAAGDDEPPPHGGKRAPAVAVAAGEVLPSILYGRGTFRAHLARGFAAATSTWSVPCARWVPRPHARPQGVSRRRTLLQRDVRV